MKWYIPATGFLYLVGSSFIVLLDLISYSPMKDLLLVCFLIGGPLSVISAALMYLLRRKAEGAFGWWFALVFLSGEPAVAFSYFFLPTGLESVWDPIGGFWGINSLLFSLLIALPMSLVDFFSKQARLRGVAGIVISLATLPIGQAIMQWVIAYKQLSFK